jgi:hypothetical protein
LAVAVLMCAAGAGLVSLAAGRTWTVRVEDRPAPLPDARTALAGADLLPWLPALGWASLAAAGALLALRGYARRGVGCLLAAAGVVMSLAAVWGSLRPDSNPGWPALGLLGSVMVVVAGWLASARGRDWPALGARYERGGTPAPPAPAPPGDLSGPGPRPDREKEMWDALDRGEDPTA